jgi:diaminopimelate decarboxylase
MLVEEKVKSPALDKKGELQLRPKTNAFVQSFLASKQMLELSQAFGSPLNIMFPELLSENLDRFQSVFAKHRLKGRIYFAHKANRADSVPRTLALQNSYIDVSSLHELRHALGSGFSAQRIQATGPKNSQFLTLCLQHNIVVAADCLQELQEIISLRQQLGCHTATNLLLRVCGFKDRQGKYRGKASRFGIAYSDIGLTFNLLEEHTNQFNLLGFSFHLDTVSPLEKSLAVESCFALIEEAMDRGFEPSVLNIGGGFKVNYLDSADDWHAYTAAIREAGTRFAPAHDLARQYIRDCCQRKECCAEASTATTIMNHRPAPPFSTRSSNIRSIPLAA